MPDTLTDKKSPSDRRQRRAMARRNQILEVAARLFAEKGFHRTTTRDIAKAADISEGSLYNYFTSKEDLLLGIMTCLSENQHLIIPKEQNLLQEMSGFIQTILHNRYQFTHQNWAMLQSVLSEIMVNPELRRRYYQELVLPNLQTLESHLHGRFPQGRMGEIEASLVVRLLSALMTGLYVLEVLGDPVVQERHNELTQLITHVFVNLLEADPNLPT